MGFKCDLFKVYMNIIGIFVEINFLGVSSSPPCSKKPAALTMYPLVSVYKNLWKITIFSMGDVFLGF